MAENKSLSNLTIIEIFKKLQNREFKLPSFQRNFTWSYAKIIRFFDSIMTDCPIYPMLVQRITGKKKSGLEYYEFSDAIGDAYKPTKISDPQSSFWSVIDGQQRLTALFIGLSNQGHYFAKGKTPGKKNTTKKDRKLYFNPLKEGSKDSDSYNRSDEETTIYGFSFYEEDVAQSLNESNDPDDGYWFKVSDIKKFKSKKGNDFDEKVLDDIKDKTPKLAKLESRDYKILKDNMRCLYNRIYTNQNIISFSRIKTKCDEDEVLDIFVRVNIGGQQLSFADFMLAEMSSSSGLDIDDCKNTIAECVNEVNEIIKYKKFDDTAFYPFHINTENVLRAILVCSANNSDDIKFSSFLRNRKTRGNGIKENLKPILKCIVGTYNLLEILGFDGKIIPRNSFNLLIPIIFYLYHNVGVKQLDTFLRDVRRDEYEGFRNDVIWYIAVTALSSVFSTNNDAVLWNLLLIGKYPYQGGRDRSYSFVPTKVIQGILKNDTNIDRTKIPADWIEKRYKPMSKNDIENIVDTTTYGSKNIRLILALLYPSQCTGLIDKDHLHPQSLFKNKSKLAREGITDPEHISKCDSLLNLQPYYQNLNLGSSKNDRPLLDWYRENNKTPKDLLLDEIRLPRDFTDNNFEELLKLENFEPFIKYRRKAIVHILSDKLAIKPITSK